RMGGEWAARAWRVGLGEGLGLAVPIDEGEPRPAFKREPRSRAEAKPGVPVYPPVPAGQSANSLRGMCEAIVEANFDGAMFAGLEKYDQESRATIRQFAQRVAGEG